jgi:hypothetical protein
MEAWGPHTQAERAVVDRVEGDGLARQHGMLSGAPLPEFPHDRPAYELLDFGWLIPALSEEQAIWGI